MVINNLFLRFGLPRENFNAVAGVLGITILGVLSLWFPTAVLNISMPENMVLSKFVVTIWQTLVLVILPYLWAIKRLDMSLADLGVGRKNLGLSIVLGCALYSIALIVFIDSLSTAPMQNHIMRHLDTQDASLMLFTMALGAAGTDFTTRGFILLALTKYSHVAFAIIVQNLFWFVGHISEIHFLAGSIGMLNAMILTLVLGILGDIIVLKIGNVLGLAIAHILLNVILTVLMRM